MMQLTEHFTLEELTHSDTAMRMGIYNTPSSLLLPNLMTLATGMEQVRAILNNNPIVASSGYRCEALEKILCAKDYAAWCGRRGKLICEESWREYFVTKAHPKGLSCDYTCSGFGTPRQIVEAIQASDLQFDQCIMEGTWVHTSFDPRMRRQVLLATFSGGVPSYQQVS